MDIIGIIIVNIVFGLLGAILRFIFLNIWNLFQAKEFVKFKDIWSDKKTTNGKYDNFFVNVILGAIAFFVFAILVI